MAIERYDAIEARPPEGEARLVYRFDRAEDDILRLGYPSQRTCYGCGAPRATVQVGILAHSPAQDYWAAGRWCSVQCWENYQQRINQAAG